MLQQEAQAPRAYYGPRATLPQAYGHKPEFRLYGKTLGGERGKEALPPAWFILSPNRIVERREQHGYASTLALLRAMGSITYPRLRKIETGRVIARDSEYDLIARHLGIDADDLKLPLLTRSETVEWEKRWGPRKRIEEGGDHDAVVLAAFTRRLFAMHEMTRHTLLKSHGINSQSIGFMWYAEKPIDRHPDSTMRLMMQLAEAKTWDEVIQQSRRAYELGLIADEIRRVQAPRVRYAPEDPDRRAPWTYEIDPFRPKVRKMQTLTPYSARIMPSAKERKLIERDRRRHRARMMVRAIVRYVADNPMEDHLIESIRKDKLHLYADLTELQRKTLVVREWLLTRVRTKVERDEACRVLGISDERFRQMHLTKLAGEPISVNRAIKPMEMN